MIHIMRGKSQARAQSKPGKLLLRSAARSTEFAKTSGQNAWFRTLPELVVAYALPPAENMPELKGNMKMAYSRKSLLRRTNDR